MGRICRMKKELISDFKSSYPIHPVLSMLIPPDGEGSGLVPAPTSVIGVELLKQTLKNILMVGIKKYRPCRAARPLTARALCHIVPRNDERLSLRSSDCCPVPSLPSARAWV
ncbi:MAG TPA: hypothetical protein VF240_18285, partial [Pyrinomonadaceae bacterium]